MTEKVALITGASSGIGKATALKLHEAGWRVVATVRDQKKAPDLPRDGLTLVEMNVTDRASIKSGIANVIKDTGRIDLLVNNAGCHVFGFFEEVRSDDLTDQIETNLMGPIWVMRAALPQMRAQGSGRIINVTSLAAFTGPPLNSYYAASKWGLEGLSEALAAELRPFNVVVKLVEPGLTRTNIDARRAVQEIEKIDDYNSIRQRVYDAITPDPEKNGFPAELIAAEILRAATDESDQLRYPASPDAKGVFDMRDKLGSEGFLIEMRTRYPV